MLDIPAQQLQSLLSSQGAQGYWARSLNARASSSGILFTVVLKRMPSNIETKVVWGLNAQQHFESNQNLLLDKWVAVSTNVVIANRQMSIHSVYERDRRYGLNVTIPQEELLPQRQGLYGFDFQSFAQLTLFWFNQRLYPFYISVYQTHVLRNSLFSVVYEQKGTPVNNTGIFFRWGNNITEAHDQVAFYQAGWDPVMIMGYTFNGSPYYYIQWERKND